MQSNVSEMPCARLNPPTSVTLHKTYVNKWGCTRASTQNSRHLGNLGLFKIFFYFKMILPFLKIPIIPNNNIYVLSFLASEEIKTLPPFSLRAENMCCHVETIQQAPWCGLFKLNLNHLVCDFFWLWPNMTSCFWGERLKKSHKKTQRASWISKAPYKALLDGLNVQNKKHTEFISFKMHVGLRIMERGA